MTDELNQFNSFELNVLKLLHCIATMRRGHTYEQNVYLNLVEKVLFPEVEND